MDVRPGEVRPGAGEHGDMGRREGEQARPPGDVVDDLTDEPAAPGHFVDGDHVRLQPPGHGDHIVVLKVGAHARRIAHDGHAKPLKQLAFADPGQLQKLG